MEFFGSAHMLLFPFTVAQVILQHMLLSHLFETFLTPHPPACAAGADCFYFFKFWAHMPENVPRHVGKFVIIVTRL